MDILFFIKKKKFPDFFPTELWNLTPTSKTVLQYIFWQSYCTCSVDHDAKIPAQTKQEKKQSST